MPIQKLATKTKIKIDNENCIDADSEINNEHCIAADLEIGNQNYIDVDSKIGSQKMHRCRFRNQKPNYAAADSKIGIQKLCWCRFKNQQQKALSLPIQKSTAKNYVAADSKISSDSGVFSTLLLLFFWCLHSQPIGGYWPYLMFLDSFF